MKFEHRSYEADASEEECQAMADRVSMLSEGILLWEEMPVQSVYSVNVMEARAKELTNDLKTYARVVDLSEAARPDAQVRRRLRHFIAAEDRLQHIALFTQKNVLINVAIKFVFSGMVKNVPISVHETYEEAVEACREAMQAGEGRGRSQ